MQLYNAYANWAMCKAGFEVLDVYPLSASFPNGTDSSHDPFDSVNYKDSVFKPAEEILLEYFSSRNDKESMPVLRDSLSNGPNTRCASGSGNGLRIAYLMLMINL